MSEQESTGPAAATGALPADETAYRGTNRPEVLARMPDLNSGGITEHGRSKRTEHRSRRSRQSRGWLASVPWLSPKVMFSSAAAVVVLVTAVTLMGGKKDASEEESTAWEPPAPAPSAPAAPQWQAAPTSVPQVDGTTVAAPSWQPAATNPSSPQATAEPPVLPPTLGPAMPSLPTVGDATHEPGVPAAAYRDAHPQPRADSNRSMQIGDRAATETTDRRAVDYRPDYQAAHRTDSAASYKDKLRQAYRVTRPGGHQAQAPAATGGAYPSAAYPSTENRPAVPAAPPYRSDSSAGQMAPGAARFRGIIENPPLETNR